MSSTGNQYDHLFVKHMPVCGPDDFNNEGEAAELEPPKNLGEPNWLVHAGLVPDAKINMTHIWIHETEVPELWVVPHVHDYDEILIWTGGDPGNPHDLGAEIYMDIAGERHTITTSGCVYIPAGVEHCPLGFTRVDRPFRFSALSLAPHYVSDREERAAERAGEAG